MHYYKAKVKYIGTKYAGFQLQSKIETVQSEFNDALLKIITEKFTTMPASRTDTGVHALEQIVKITSYVPIDISVFVKKINELLSSQIRCIDIINCEGSFRPAAEARLKEYRYFFTNKTQVSKSDRLFIANISNQLDFDMIKKCLLVLKGEHDFCNFYSSGSNIKSTIRNISLCELLEVNPNDIFKAHDLFQIPDSVQKCYQLRFEANGFLKQMIRHIVSALWMVGSGKLTIEEFRTYLTGPKMEKQLWKVAPPNGLFLFKISY